MSRDGRSVSKHKRPGGIVRGGDYNDFSRIVVAAGKRTTNKVSFCEVDVSEVEIA